MLSVLIPKPRLKLIEVSGLKLPSNSFSEIIKLEICPFTRRSSIISLAALKPITEYPELEFAKLKYSCLKSGVLNPLPIEILDEILSFNCVLNANLGLNSESYLSY